MPPLDDWLRWRLSRPSSLRAALTRWQAARLAATLRRAGKRSAHYARALAGLNPQPLLRGLDGLTAWPEEAVLRDGEALIAATLDRLPFTYPDNLAAEPESFLAVGHDAVEGIISLATSGTSSPQGQGKRVFCTRGDLESSIAFFRHGMRHLAEAGRDRVALLMSGGREGSVGQLFQEAMRRLNVPCVVPGFPLDEEACLETLLDFAPTCLVGLPAHLLSLARHPKAKRLAGRLKSVLLSGDVAAPPLRRAIEEALGCRVFLHYGLTEFGLGGGVECGERHGLHWREADLLLECAEGEIIITSLTRQAMPLLRYRTGDRGALLKEPCPCGSALYRLLPGGRLAGRLPLGDGLFLHWADLDELLLPLPWLKAYGLTARFPSAGAPCPDELSLTVYGNAAGKATGAAEELVRAALAPLLPSLESRRIALNLRLEVGCAPFAPKRKMKIRYER